MTKEAQIFAPKIPRIGDVILDTDLVMFALDNWGFHEEHPSRAFSFMDILSFFSLAEAMVLNERLLSEHVGDYMRHFKHLNSVVKLVEKGIICYIQPIRDYKKHVPSEYSKYVWHLIENDAEVLAGLDWSGADFTLSVSFERAQWAAERGIDHLSWPIFDVLTRISISKPIQSMMRKIYAELNQSLESRVCKLKGVGCPIPMYIPPIVALILERCDGNASRFFDEAIILREEFQGFRKKYLEYQKLIANPTDMSLGELFQTYQDAVSDVSRQLQHISQKRTDSKLVFEIWDALCELKVAGELGNPLTTASLNLGTLLSKGIKGIEVQRIKARARMLFDLWKKVVQIRNYGELMTRTFKMDSNELFKMTQIAERLATKCNRLAGVRRKQLWERL